MTAELDTLDDQLLPEVDMTFDQAETFVKNLQAKIKRVNADIEEIQLDIATFYAQDGWQVLGYDTWDEFAIAKLKTQIKLPRADRQSLALTYRKAGMSQAAIAQVLGVDRSTVTRDLESSGENAPEDAPIKGRDGRIIDPDNQQRFTCVACHKQKPFDTRIELDDGLYCEPCAEAAEAAAEYLEEQEPIDAEVVSDETSDSAWCDPDDGFNASFKIMASHLKGLTHDLTNPAHITKLKRELTKAMKLIEKAEQA